MRDTATSRRRHDPDRPERLADLRHRSRRQRRRQQRPAARARPRDRRRPGRRARPPARHPRDDRQRELRAARRPRGAGLGAHQQVRRGLPGQAVLRRLRARRRRREPRPRPRQGAVRRRARQRPAARRRAGQRRRHARADPSRRHHPRPRAGPRRPPHARHEDQLLRPALRRRRLRRLARDPPGRHGRGAPDRQGAAARSSSSPAGPRTRGTSTSPRSARSPTRSARCSWSTWRTSPAWSPRACTRRPVPHADVVTTTVHKTLGGPRSGTILCRAEHAKKIDSAVFPGQQGGPLMHAVAAKAVAFKVAAGAEFKARQERTLEGARILADRLTGSDVARRRGVGAHRRHRRAPGPGRPARQRRSTASRPRTGCTRPASP